ncbi:hypothetical protein PTE01_25560 [Pseudoalteromonas tetraodonis GFC]|uniref:Uncharacterized protein n=1 Tax=Pseudoalteromonas tetraodonis GFC TaxID=1315271 RepID=A0AA37S305_9GAMM|nr:hypothetical protein PTE01_25560 [Pseudoalteromonas tetraodonis GFC]GLQ02667.1 hypothetical protein GCM10007914_15480 [Pseudoalteromonas tetraodonis GFC]
MPACANAFCELKAKKLTKQITVNKRMTNPLENNKLLKLTDFQAQKKRLKRFFNINQNCAR